MERKLRYDIILPAAFFCAAAMLALNGYLICKCNAAVSYKLGISMYISLALGICSLIIGIYTKYIRWFLPGLIGCGLLLPEIMMYGHTDFVLCVYAVLPAVLGLSAGVAVRMDLPGKHTKIHYIICGMAAALEIILFAERFFPVKIMAQKACFWIHCAVTCILIENLIFYLAGKWKNRKQMNAKKCLVSLLFAAFHVVLIIIAFSFTFAACILSYPEWWTPMPL